ncbi:MAG: hypothetical protein NTV92_04625 [Candidatus Bipolaricaulota bacterium]|nr:hypothetical protein [Candidatus Bipolaricaulota bacterium]
MIKTTASLTHWEYFLALEADLGKLSRYVQFSECNFGTYSIEIAHLLLAASSEVDVVIKAYCDELGHDVGNMDQYRSVLQSENPALGGYQSFMPRFGLQFKPWENLRDGRPPNWWSDYNKVKHHRDVEFGRANLGNVLNAMAGLFLILLVYYEADENIKRIVPAPTLFRPPVELGTCMHALDGETGIFLARRER